MYVLAELAICMYWQSWLYVCIGRAGYMYVLAELAICMYWQSWLYVCIGRAGYMYVLAELAIYFSCIAIATQSVRFVIISSVHMHVPHSERLLLCSHL